MTDAEMMDAMRARLLEARAKLSEAFGILDDVGPTLPELERGAVLLLRTEVGEVHRRLGNVCAFLGGARGSEEAR